MDSEKLSPLTNAELEAQRLALELEERELDLKMKRIDVELKKEAWENLQRQRAARKEQILNQRRAVEAFLQNRILRQTHCNHRKGGTGHESIVKGEGRSSYYAVIKHQLPVGKYMVLCQRCGKEWHPNLSALENNGIPKPATKGYARAFAYATNNSPSGSSMFRFETIADYQNRVGLAGEIEEEE